MVEPDRDTERRGQGAEVDRSQGPNGRRPDFSVCGEVVLANVVSKNAKGQARKPVIDWNAIDRLGSGLQDSLDLSEGALQFGGSQVFQDRNEENGIKRLVRIGHFEHAARLEVWLDALC